MFRMRTRATTVTMMLVAALGMAACGSEEANVSDALLSTPTDEFALVEHDGATHVVGHALTMEVPSGWTDYEPEFEGLDGTTYEWAVGEPEEVTPMPANVQVSAGMENRGARMDGGMEVAAEKIAELSPGYELVDSGDVDVDGSEQAKFLRFKHDLDYNGETVRVEQVTLMIEVDDDHSSTLRFIAVDGQWEEKFEAVYDSVKVTS